ncbi:Lin1244/Lin1753 domain-containing protein [Parabacteroides chinchillae]|uniref:Lin1244/Lin1753 domain-containing protein n=1 Tax=Parabacteroides chinchillae TaxID=871327 RepID=UPI0011B0ADC1|nr:Lin1244/Lin1753 domain-containing protein [Parabacteroides chinchillae]
MVRKYGADGVMLYITLLCDIYANSYYIEVMDDYLFDLSEQLDIDKQKKRWNTFFLCLK